MRIQDGGSDEISVITAGFNAMVRKILVLIENVKTQETRKRHAELDFLQAQINPHFLVNTLNAVVWMANVQGTHNIAGLCTSLSGLLSGTMKRGKTLIPLRDELGYIDCYADIQKYRYMDKFEMEYDLSPDTQQLYVLRFILQPLVENALLHGIDPLENRGGKIVIRARCAADALVICVHDNGVGIAPDKLEQLTQSRLGRESKTFSSIGVRNVHERLQLMFGEQYGLSFESQLDCYTLATITMPILQTDEESVKGEATCNIAP